MIEINLDKDFADIMAIEVESVSKSAPICPFVAGEPGIGKSSIVKAMCKERGWHYFELQCNQLGDKADITGCRSVKDTVIRKDGSTEEIWKQIFFPHQSLQDAITCAQDNPDDIVVLFLDEINRASSDVTSAVLSFTTARKVGTYEFPTNVRFITAGNDKGNVTSLDSASISRFSTYKVRPTAAAFLEYMDTRINPYIKQVLTANPDYILCKNSAIVTSTVSGDDGDSYDSEYEAFDDSAEGFEQFTTPRTIEGLNEFLNACDSQKIAYLTGQVSRNIDTGEDISLLQAIVHSHVGDTLFANAVCALIADDVARGVMQKATNLVAPKPSAGYKALCKCTDRQTRDSMIANMSDDERSEVLLYAVYEKGKDNSDLINSVASKFGGQCLTKDFQPQFSALKAHDELDNDNYTALINSGTPLGNMMRNILGE